MVRLSSIFSSDAWRAAWRLGRELHQKHVIMFLGAVLFTIAWVLAFPFIAPNNRDLAYQALSPETTVLICGSSRIERGIDPRLLSFESVNLGSGGYSYIYWTPIIQRAIERAPNVELVLLEADIFALRNRWPLGRRFYDYGLPLRDWPISARVKFRQLYRRWGRMAVTESINPEYFLESLHPTRPTVRAYAGYLPFRFERNLLQEEDRELYGTERYLNMHINLLTEPIEDSNINALLELINWLESRNIGWALLHMPELRDWHDGMPDDWNRAVARQFERLHERRGEENVHFWDASGILNFDKSYFQDGLHLNRTGVIRFAPYLDAYIADRLGQGPSEIQARERVSEE